MNFQRYFRSDQQVVLQVTNPADQNGRTELMTAYVVSSNNGILVVSLPYGENALDKYPFNEEMIFEITTNALGMGLRAHGTFSQKISGRRFAIKLRPDLQMFQRRQSPRIDCQLGIRFSRASNTLQAMREIWEKNVKLLSSPEAAPMLDGFKPAKINLSPEGIRLTIKPPAVTGELCLVLIDLGDGKQPVCVIAEIIWSAGKDESSIVAGMRFINILQEDQQRIDKYIKDKK
ncbi:MAG: hypothetical protein C0622_14385 [Desulfuromonas sp.]|nr:MAG: hypothetical protein C0622_14385 [Desulfuromonas sp.]